MKAFIYREFKCVKEEVLGGKRMRNTSGDHKEKGDAKHKEKGEKAGHIQEVKIRIMKHHAEGWNETKMY